MIREYAFERKVTEPEAEVILRESRELEGAKSVNITDDMLKIDVEADNGDYPLLMERILHIVSRETGGQWISFRRFL